MIKFRYKTKIEKAVSAIQSYCYKHDKCEGCVLVNEKGYCKLTECAPVDWDILFSEKANKVQEEKDD